MIKPQLFIGEKPDPKKFMPVKNKMLNKPIGGLWTSSYIGEHGSDWMKWTFMNGWYDGQRDGWIVKPKENAMIYTIDSYEDLEELMEEYAIPIKKGFSMQSIDFEVLAKDFDGIHLTKQGEGKTRLSHPHHLYGWDVECILWLHYCFGDVQKVEHEFVAL